MLVYSRNVDKIDKDIGLSSSLNKQPTLSTGSLAHDLMLGHGYIPGFNVNFGAEQSAKSTGAMTTLGESLRMPIAVRKLFDAEGTTDRRYAGNILRTDAFDSVFGSRTTKGDWITPPLCRYHDSAILEEVFLDIHRVARMMPDKVFRPEIGNDGEWFLVFDRTKPQTAMLKEMGLTPDKHLFTKTGKYWCSVGDDQSPQGLIIVDSFPSLLSRDLDEESTSNKALAVDARYLGKYLKLVRGKMRPKGIILLGVNQLRDNPGAGPGQMPFYEPCGNVLRLASDTRTMFTSRIPMDGFPRCEANKGLCEEPSFEYPGGKDLYAFKGLTNYKNKYGTPGRKTSIRVWIKDGNGAPRGIDPAYDTYRFLDDIGVITGPIHDSRRTFRIDLPPIKDVEWKWPIFKATILAEESGDKKLWAKARELGAPNFKLRAHCKKLLSSGKAEELMVLAARKQREKPVTVDIEADDDE
jgi:RecA/RadA recombinase